MKKRVQVLLSTYNGEKYLEEQLESIINQEFKDFSILIRDDGSTDRTLSILKDYAERYSNISYYKGQNIGVIKSFFDLMINADDTADYFSFSDQDDIWMTDKISRAVKKLELIERELPLLYCSSTILVDKDLIRINSSIKKHSIRPDFGNALIENICTGCTCVINKELLHLAKKHVPQNAIMHDWWLYLIASCFGSVYYDENSYILYRQHENNVLGSRSNYLDEFRIRIKNHKRNHGKISNQVKEFSMLYELIGYNGFLTNLILNYKKNFICRIKAVTSKKIFRQRCMDNFIFRVLFLIGHV